MNLSTIKIKTSLATRSYSLYYFNISKYLMKIVFLITSLSLL